MDEENKEPRRGYYVKKLAEIKDESGKMQRGKKKGVKKQNLVVCKEARERKKEYVKALEKNNQMLIAQNNNLRGQLQHMRNFYNAETQHLKKEINTLKQHLQHIKINGGVSEIDHRTKMLAKQFKELMTMIKKQDKEQISRSLCVLRDRFGISGKQRKKWIKENIQRTIELAMPLHFRVLIENVEDPYKFFELLGGSEQMRSFRLHFDQSQKAILMKMKPRIKKAKQSFNRIFQKLHQFWKQLSNYSQKAQKIIDSIEQNLDPIFVGSLLINLDSRRCSHDEIKQIYPINFFKGLPEEDQHNLIDYVMMETQNYIGPQDSFAFGAIFQP